MMIAKIRRKSALVAILVAVAFLLSASHSMAMPGHMSDMGCQSKILCGSCTTPVVSDALEIEITPCIQKSVMEPGLRFPPLHSTTLYHPPR